MFTSATRFLVSLFAVFILLTAMWVTAAHAAPMCRSMDDGITACDGAQLPAAPRGTVRHLPRVPTYRVNSVRGGSMVGAQRMGVTTVVHMGVRG